MYNIYINVKVTELTAWEPTLVTPTTPPSLSPLHARRYARQWVEVGRTCTLHGSGWRGDVLWYAKENVGVWRLRGTHGMGDRAVLPPRGLTLDSYIPHADLSTDLLLFA